ncbi:MAG TPA: ATP-binding protein [Verrucomicrobiae bacterium]|nr:ATP-binding protein [Verrucomicrobiae bacterium]
MVLVPGPFFLLQKTGVKNNMALMRPPFLICSFWLLLVGVAAAQTESITNLARLQLAADSDDTNACRIRLDGDVWWANPGQKKFVLGDDSGAAEIEADIGREFPQAGRRVRLDGVGTIGHAGAAIRLGTVGLVVDNNGVHSMFERSGAVFLTAGKNPVEVDWFNGVEKYGLEISWEGPGTSRQKIPDHVLFRQVGANHFVNGLNYECVDAPGEVLPDFDGVAALKAGVVTNFDLGIVPRGDHIGVRFRGWLDAPVPGLYRFYLESDDGSQLRVGEQTMRCADIGAANFPAPVRVVPGQVLDDRDDCRWAQVEGTVTFANQNAREIELNSGAGKMAVEIADPAGFSFITNLHRRVRATGVCEAVVTADEQKIAGRLLVSGADRIVFLDGGDHAPASSSTNLPELTTCAEVHHLSREEAQRAYPVRLRGVVTGVLPERSAFTIQDSTRGLYVEDWSEKRSAPPQIGDFLEVRGVTDPSLFAPIVKATRLVSGGAGKLPEPVRPTWDQLLNGSLDAQYVELQGIITAVVSNSVTLLTRDGRIKLEMRVNGAHSSALTQYEDSLVTIRGILLASWDYVTHEVRIGEIRLYGADLSVDAPAPADLFALPPKTVAQLQMFDPQAGVFQRVKVAGQVLDSHGTEKFMTDGRNGLRFITKKDQEFQPGDLIEVVGFPQLSAAAPVLREAVAKKVGRAALPAPVELSGDNLVQGNYDAALVRIRGTLVSTRETGAEQIFEMQNGVRSFVARLDGAKFDAPPAGSKLELTGVYAGLGGDKAIGQGISSFEILLDAPGEIRVLSRPPWWTLERLLMMMAALAGILAVTVLWITQLRRKVDQRTLELEVQIRERERVEQQRVMEQERARVAQDLHDELGSSLTEISMLGERAQSASASVEKRRDYLEQMGAKARAMVTALDEIVWAMNPRHDSLASLVSYFCLYADRFLGLANMAWKLEDSGDGPEVEIDSHCRHQLFLAFKEALTNVVRHSRATEVRLSIRQENGGVQLTIADNGGGLRDGLRTEEMDGVANMRARLEKLGGRFDISSEPGRGVTVQFYVPTKYDHRRHC